MVYIFEFTEIFSGIFFNGKRGEHYISENNRKLAKGPLRKQWEMKLPRKSSL